MDLRSYRSAARKRRPLLRKLPEASFAPLAVTPGEVGGLVRRGVPFHMAVERAQDERPRVEDVDRRLAAGETLFLVQPHEYMPRLRRFLHQAGRALGFAGRPAATFLFRVDVGGRLAMGLHDDGDSDLLWLQLGGERALRFGAPGAKGKDRPLSAADGNTIAWFKGGLEAGDLLYLPPHAPHDVQCRRASLAVSIYWEAVSVDELAAQFLQETGDAKRLRALPEAREVAGALRDAARRAPAEYAAWSALLRTADGGRDAPAGAGAFGDPAALVSAWRAFEIVAVGRKTLSLAAAGDRLLDFPARTSKALAMLSNYGQATRDALEKAAGLRPAELTALLQILSAEGLVTTGELPAVGAFDPGDLTGWDYEDR